MSIHPDAAARLCISECHFHHWKHAAHLQGHGQVDHALFAPLRANGFAIFVIVGGPADDRIGKAKCESRRFVHGSGVAAKHGFYLVACHAGFQCHVDHQLRAGAAVFRHRAQILAAKLASTGTASRWFAALFKAANLKNADGDAFNISSR